MDFNKKDFYGIVAKERKQVQITIDQDCNVPDTKPDVEKMIQTKGLVIMQETEMMVDRIRIKGEFHFSGLYGTIDARTYLESLDFVLPFEEYIHMDGAVPTDYVKVSYVIDDINTVLINSRKLSIRILLTLTLHVNEEIKEEGIIDVLGDGISSLKKEVQVTDLIVNKKDIARMKEELVLPANKSNIYEILWSQVELENVQGKLKDHSIDIQGDMHVFILYLGEDEQLPVQYARWEIPLHTELECYECAPGMIGKIHISLGNHQLEIRPDVDGEERVVSVDATLECDIKVYEDQVLSYVGDCYTMQKTLVPEYKDFAFESLIGKNQATMKMAKRFSIEQEPGKLLQVLSVKGSCNIDDVEVKEQGLQVEGVLMADVLFLSSEDQNPVMSSSYMEPFSYFIEAKGLMKEDDYQLDVMLDHISATPTEGDEIEIKANVIFDFISFHKKAEKIMTNVAEQPLDYEELQKIPGIVGYIVKDGDTLWSIAKRYFTTVDDIRDQNEGIEEVKPGDKLLIVKEIEWN